jgi:hypothetical protein
MDTIEKYHIYKTNREGITLNDTHTHTHTHTHTTKTQYSKHYTNITK